MFYNNNTNDYSNLNVRNNINTFYEHINGGGAHFTIFSGDSNGFTGGGWGDNISSVIVAPHTLVILFEDRNFQGDLYKLINNGDHPHLFNLPTNWNDRTSSIVTSRLK
ncbi:peptidase inhibitor family I36 protein [Bacillus cytotoxicus]|uniref:peptidase inhibitor family I36 protein n=1 Tax=Bacillus cytotoxicus TaxID=580165 RepID=UPI003B7A3EED